MNQPAYTIEVISPQFPCGAAWLANALLELRVPLWHLWGFDTRQEWEVSERGGFCYAAKNLPWRQTLASLRLGRVFDFQADIRPRFSHALPWQIDLASPVILVVRDPRDALYSEWQRHRRNLHLPSTTSFTEFLASPFFESPISVVDMLWLHLHSWLIIRERFPQRIYLLRFEDWKRAPLNELRAVTRWMGLQADEGALTHAVGVSDVRYLQEIESALSLTDPAARQFNRRGIPEEWRETWEESWFTAMGEHWQPILSNLGYTPLKEPGTATKSSNLNEMLTLHGLTDPAQCQVGFHNESDGAN